MENYIVINGKKAELTDKQLKQLGIESEKKRNNPFNSELKFDEKYYRINTINGVFSASFKDKVDEDFIVAANSFNDCKFAYQVFLHELLNRKLLKYAWDNNAEDCLWDEYGVNSHYYIYFDSTKGHFNVQANQCCHHQNIYFSSKKVAKQAIKDVIEPFMKEHPKFVW